VYGYGNARVAALRARLIGPALLRQLAESDSPAAMLEQLDRLEDWHPFLAPPPGNAAGEGSGDGADPAQAVLWAIERHRSARLGTLLRWYPPPARALVEALVMSLDLERMLELLRLRAAGVATDDPSRTVLPGAILDARRLAGIAAAPTSAEVLRLLARAGVIDAREAGNMATASRNPEDRATVEAALLAAWAHARRERAAGGGRDAALVREIIAAELAAEQEMLGELAAHGLDAAVRAERGATLTRLDALARRARRDPLGIGVVAGYVAAVEAQAIRLRAILGRVGGRWDRERVAAWLPSGG
jgi:vacuolar-type H+-ATPase subunit C/Vma6